MKLLFHLSLLLLFASCNPQKQSAQKALEQAWEEQRDSVMQSIEEKSAHIRDSLKSDSIEKVILEQNQLIDATYSMSKGQSEIKLYLSFRSFVSLSDSYPYEKYPLKDIIDEDYLLEQKIDSLTIDKVERKLFMQRLGLEETDSLFACTIDGSKTSAYALKDLRLIAELSVYGSDYHLGFAHPQGKQFEELIVIDKKNPFVTNQMVPMVWEKVSESTFPKVAMEEVLENGLMKMKKSSTYHTSVNQLDYYIQDYVTSQYSLMKHFVVLNKQEQTLFNQIFQEGESLNFDQIAIKGDETETSPNQYTGYLFKDQPPVMFFFYYESFGCPAIFTLNLDVPNIETLCDNRH